MQDLIEAYMSVYGDIEEAKLPYTRRSMGLESQFVTKTGEEKTQARIDQLRQSHNTADNKRANTLERIGKQTADREAAEAKAAAMTTLRNRERTRAQAARDMEESHKFPLSDEEKELARKIGQHADTKAKRMSAESPTKSAKKRTKMSDVDIKESHDFFDVVLSHLLDEGYCDSQESAITMMAAMSQNWIDSILSEAPFQISGPHPTTVDDTKLDYTPSNVGKPYQNKKRAQTRADKLNQDHGASVYRVTKVD
jgi:hypothetical protein